MRKTESLDSFTEDEIDAICDALRPHAETLRRRAAERELARQMELFEIAETIWQAALEIVGTPHNVVLWFSSIQPNT